MDVVKKSVELASSLTLASGETVENISYDSLVLATGGQPRTLAPLPGWNLQNVFVLRTVKDANSIAKASKGKHLPVVLFCSYCIGGVKKIYKVRDSLKL